MEKLFNILIDRKKNVYSTIRNLPQAYVMRRLKFIQMKISKKKETELYELLHKELMDARVKISMKLKGTVHHTVLNDVDDVMSNLTMKAPLKAIRLFNPNAL